MNYFALWATIICILFVVIIIVAILSYMKKKRKEQGQVFSAPVVVTSTHTTAAGYPTTVEPTPSGGYQAAPYPTAMPMPMVQPGVGVQPYPLHPGAMPMPMSQAAPYPPPNIGFQPHTTPYPPEIPPSQVNPPSYDQVVAAESYAKQAPYNPSYPAPGH